MNIIDPPWSGTVIDRWNEEGGIRKGAHDGDHALVVDVIDDRFVNMTLFRWHTRMRVWVVEGVMDIPADAYKRMLSAVSNKGFPPA